MPWILDTETGRTQLEISGRWHPDHDLSRAFSACYRLPESVVPPVHVVLTSAPDRLPEYTALINMQIFVGATAKRFIEEYQPGSAVFTDAHVTMPDGRIYDEPIYLLTFENTIYVEDAIVDDRSDVAPSRITHVKAPGGKMIALPARLELTHHPPRLTWHRSVVGDRHIWIDHRLQNKVAVSDEMYQTFKDAGVTGFQAQESRFLLAH